VHAHAHARPNLLLLALLLLLTLLLARCWPHSLAALLWTWPAAAAHLLALAAMQRQRGLVTLVPARTHSQLSYVFSSYS
jgi:hypothetical protein